MLDIHDLTVVFQQGTSNEKRALNHVSCTIQQGDFITVIGSNGAGKSTFLNAIHGSFITPKGTIWLDGKDISDQKQYIRAQTIGRLYQDPMLGTAPKMTVLENICLSKKQYQPFSLLPGVRKHEINEIKASLSTLSLGLEDQLAAEVGKLSGGQRQALALFMATLTTPRLLLLDEHTAALDPHTARIIMELTNQLITKHRITTLMITHDMKQALQYGNKLMVMDQGEVVSILEEEQKRAFTIQDMLALFEKKNIAVADRMI